MTSEDELPALSIEDTKLIIAKLGDLTNEIVLIGGQAAGFWAGYYGVETDQPLTSKDIDFCGNIAAVRECAKRLGGKARLAGMDRATPVLGVVYYVDREQHERKIDFLGNAFGVGLDYDKIRELAIVVDLDETCTFRVMHPLHNLESRTHNVAGLPDQYNNPLGLTQLRASIVCARAFLRTILDNEESSGIRHVLNLNTRIFKFAAYDTHALAVYRDHGIDVSMLCFWTSDCRSSSATMATHVGLSGSKNSAASSASTWTDRCEHQESRTRHSLFGSAGHSSIRPQARAHLGRVRTVFHAAALQCRTCSSRS